MSELPNGWVSTAIGAVIELNPKNNCDDTTEVGFVSMPLMGTRYLEKNKHERRIWREVKSGYTHFADGDVLLAKITPCFENGKGGLVSDLPSGLGAGSTEYFVCRPLPGALHSKYLLAHFKTRQFVRNGAVEMTGSVGHKRLPKNYVTDTAIPLAPLAEQKRIADKLDSVLARVDACRNRLDRLPALLKRFRQSILAAAISGRLTEDWRKGADISEWRNTDIQSVAHVGTGSTPLRSNPLFFAAAGTPWVTSAATSQGAVTCADQFVTSEAIVAHRLRIYPVGTLLVAMYGEGKTRGQVTELGIPATINQACAAVIVDGSLTLNAFVKFALLANYLEMRELAEGGNQPNLNLAKIKEFPLALPSLHEQHEIVRRVDILFAFADRLEARLATARKQVAQLTPALLAKAFRGELVPQDPADEPASELLKRLAAQREAAPATKRGRRNTAGQA